MKRAKSLEGKYAQVLEGHFDDDLAPFAQLFARIRNCDIQALDVMNRVPAVGAINPQTRALSMHAVKGLATVASGLATGAGAGALTFAAVGAFATASTGTAIGTLSGAAATSATLAWLGGGSLAAGGLGVAGGTAVLTGVVALPALLAIAAFAWWAGEKELTKQQNVSAQLDAAEQVARRDGKLLDTVAKQIKASTDVLGQLSEQMHVLNGWLAGVLQTHDDYAIFDDGERQRLAVLVSLATAMTAVMACPLVVTESTSSRKSGTALNPEFSDTVASVSRMIEQMVPEAP